MKKATRKHKSKTVTMIVTEKDYNHAISSGISPDEVLKPGTYVGRSGGFLERHKRDMASGRIETKSGTYVKLDRDVLRFFKAKGPKRNQAPDQTQINGALRAFIRREMRPEDLGWDCDGKPYQGETYLLLPFFVSSAFPS